MNVRVSSLLSSGGNLTERVARSVFVQVNLDDELFEQSDSDNDASELVYDEFIECLLRIGAHSTRTPLLKRRVERWVYWGVLKSVSRVILGASVDRAKKKKAEVELHEMLDAFLSETLIPAGLKK